MDLLLIFFNRTPQVRGKTRMPVERRDVLGGLIHEYRWAA